jgi:hypothetical protein
MISPVNYISSHSVLRQVELDFESSFVRGRKHTKPFDSRGGSHLEGAQFESQPRRRIFLTEICNGVLQSLRMHSAIINNNSVRPRPLPSRWSYQFSWYYYTWRYIAECPKCGSRASWSHFNVLKTNELHGFIFRKRTMPRKGSPLVGEVSANFCG